MSLSRDEGKQTMLEITVVFGDPNITNYTLLVEHRPTDDLWDDVAELRDAAEDKLGELDDEQCFYRVFQRAAPGDREGVPDTPVGPGAGRRIRTTRARRRVEAAQGAR